MKNPFSKKIQTFKVLFILIILITLAACRHKSGAEAAEQAGANADRSETHPEKSSPVAVEAMEVSSAFLVPEIRGAGVVEGLKDAWVVSEASGLVEKVYYSLGDRVPEGYVLAVMDSSLVQKKRDLARQRYRTAQLEYDAAEKSHSGGSLSLLEFNRAADRLLEAEASKIAAEEAYEHCFLKAPFGGIIALRNKDVDLGTFLKPGVPVVRIVDDSSFQTELRVGEGQILLLGEGDPARITSREGTVYPGRVAAISGGSEAGLGSYAVVVEWDDLSDHLLKPGMAVDVAIDVSRGEKRVILPDTAIRVRAGKSLVFVLEEGQAVNRQIHTGARLGGRVEVLEGLQDGEILITSGLASLAEGQSVSVSLMGKTGLTQ